MVAKAFRRWTVTSFWRCGAKSEVQLHGSIYSSSVPWSWKCVQLKSPFCSASKRRIWHHALIWTSWHVLMFSKHMNFNMQTVATGCTNGPTPWLARQSISCCKAVSALCFGQNGCPAFQKEAQQCGSQHKLSKPGWWEERMPFQGLANWKPWFSAEHVRKDCKTEFPQQSAPISRMFCVKILTLWCLPRPPLSLFYCNVLTWQTMITSHSL